MRKDVLTNLYNKHALIIYRYLLKHGCRRDVAEEIVHDSFVKAIEHFDDIEPERLPSWIFKVALNNFRNYLKKASVREELLIDWSHFLERLSCEYETEDILLAKEKIFEIYDCLNRLKESYRELLVLKYEMELSCKEIAKILGLSEQTVKTYLLRARTEFKSVWGDKYGR
ncbi:sigma-70 family RNA polymerase sigma factor [Desulfosporosinus sp. FKA]|uniref:RNA polymerase sigma factor n=1 Tax=Desulfosporosinus sp. FKA TaxID=1969834 RepID=UPI000B49C450|nr:sigma-70 family RNA polymerase sigma factor [Desulfosporosinus sp. FKA]